MTEPLPLPNEVAAPLKEVAHKYLRKRSRDLESVRLAHQTAHSELVARFGQDAALKEWACRHLLALPLSQAEVTALHTALRNPFLFKVVFVLALSGAAYDLEHAKESGPPE